MNEAERTELAHLKQRQVRLENELKLLAQQLQTFEQRLAERKLAETSLTVWPPETNLGSIAATPPPSTTRLVVQPQPASIPAPPVIAPKPVVQPVYAEEKPALPKVSVAQSTASIPQQPTRISVEPKAPSGTAPAVLSSQPEATTPPRSFEMRLGTFWLVRIGVVMVLTGLVFFGNLAYQNYISKLGAGGKVFLLYVASGVLLAAGWWWQRKAVKETLRNYAQVLFAGGLGALYFTTYAAHHLEPLRIIESAFVDGVLLSGCAAFMIWAANRKKSEVLAFFAVGLGYYTSIITRVGHFTLVSNLLLSIAAVYFLVRNRWAALSFGSLAATYAAYGFWRFFDGSNWHWASPEEGLWTGTLFLMMYWAVFTSAVFLSRESRFAGQNRASFLTANNGAFFTLFILTMLQVQHGGFWKFSLIYGLVLVVLSVLAARWLKDEPLASNMYLTQGLLLVTIGLISKFAGLRLALVLGTESVLLLILGQQRKNLVLLVGAYVTAGLAVGWGMDGMKQFDTADLWLGIGLGFLMMVDAFLAQRRTDRAGEPSNVPLPAVLRPQTSYFVVLALVIWLVATWDNCSREVFPLVVAVEAVALSASIYALRLPEVTLFAQGFLVLADVAWVFNWMDQSPVLPWWNPLLMIGTNLAVSHWWSWQRILQPKTQNRNFWPALYALAVVGVIYLWLAPKTTTPNWIVTTSLLAIGLTAYGVITRAWFVAAAGQLFVAVSIAQFALQLWQSKPPFQFPLAPIACLFLLSFATVQWFQKRPDTDEHISEPLLQLAFVYRWVALIMSLGWIWEYVPERERIWVLALLGLGIFFWAGWRRNQEALLFSAAYTATALALFWLPLLEASTVYVPNLLVILLLLAQRQVARRHPEHYPLSPGVHNAVIVVGTLSVWLFVSRWVLEMANGFYLTASWSVLALALFTTGLLLRERMYRWVGLGVLACALGRVIIFDVWKLETVYRILSFMALGIVLLVLGFIYSKYQEKIKEWL